MEKAGEILNLKNMANNQFELLPTDIQRQFEFGDGQIAGMMEDFKEDLEKGLKGEPGGMPMLPAFTDIPTGQEEGEYLAIDLGGTNLRIMSVKLANGQAEIIDKNNYVLSEQIITGSKDSFFAFIARCVKEFVGEKEGTFGLGFTFSHAIMQSSLNSGKISNFSKGYDIADAIGSDPVRELESSLAKIGINNIEIKALSNDTVGTLACGSYGDKNCDIGIVLGTGTNAAYREKTAKIKKGEFPNAKDHMIINTEWCDFACLPQNTFDKLVDSKLDGGMLEKMVSGKYLGALLRELVKELADKSLLSAEAKKEIINLPDEIFSTELISELLIDKSDGLEGVGKALKNIGIKNTGIDDRKIIKEAAQIILDRSITIVAAAAVVVLKKIDSELSSEHSIAVDGSLYEKIPGYKENFEAEIERISGKKFETFLSKDGSGIGAAILAACNEG
jgi:hexokinase